jgi:hypothetical protein
MVIGKVSSTLFSSRSNLRGIRRISFMTLRKAIMVSVVGGAFIATAAPAPAQVINFQNANQGYAYYGGYNRLMYGQGVISDPGNNVWNGFGNFTNPNYAGPGKTGFYGPGNPDSAHGSTPSGLPGNPYAWWTGHTTSGANLFSPANPSATNVGNANSDGTHSPVTLSMSYNGDNGSQTASGLPQGSPSAILSVAALTPNATTPGTFTLSNVTPGVYNLVLYGANFDGTRGAAFTLNAANGGTPVGGFTSTINPNAAPNGPLNTFVLGGDYVEFTGVVPDGSGNISGTWGAVTNPISGLGGEGDFNGLQLQFVSGVPEPSSLALLGGIGGITALIRRRRRP